MSQIMFIARSSIHAGNQDEFKAVIADCITSCKANEPGTLAYEWFINAEQTECVVLESYASTEAVLAHMENSGPGVAKLQELGAVLGVEGYGSPPDDLPEALKSAIPFVPHFQGLARDASAGSGAGADVLRMAARFKMSPDKTAEFKRLAIEGKDLVQANEPGTLLYEWFINEAGTESVVLEKYAGADALLAHMKNAGPVVGKIFALCECSIDMFADPDAQTLKMLSTLPIKLYSPLGGFER